MDELPWEDGLLERKTEGDLKDLLKTMVAFANSVHPDHIATILIGEKDDGSVQGVKNPESIQQSIRKEAEKIYPAIIWRSQIYEKDKKPCIRVEIEYSGETPHFGGIAWIRKGASTIVASDEVFQQLINLRSGKVRELNKWLDQKITIKSDVRTPNIYYQPRWSIPQPATLTLVNNFWVTFTDEIGQNFESVSLEGVTLSFDNANKRLLLITRD